MKKKTIELGAFEKAFIKTSFINNLTGEHFGNYHDAKTNFPLLSIICDKLTDRELVYLMEKIDNIM